MRLRLTLLALCIAVAPGLLTADAVGSTSAGFTFRQWLETLGPNSMAYTVQNLGSTSIRLAALRGQDFAIASVGRASTSSGPDAACALSGQPATLRCQGFELVKNASLSVEFTTSGKGTSANVAITDGAEPSVTSFFPVQAQAPQPRGTSKVERVATSRLRITVSNTGFVSWKRVIVHLRPGIRARVISFSVGNERKLAMRSGGCRYKRPKRQPGYKKPPPPEVDCDKAVAPRAVASEILDVSPARANVDAVTDIAVVTSTGIEFILSAPR